MLDFLLFAAFVSFIIVIAFVLKTRFRKGYRKDTFLFLVLSASIGLFSCGGDDPEGKDTDTILSTKNYTVYITKEDIDSIKNDENDSTDIHLSRREYSGMQLFMTHCNKCHPAGNAGVGPSLNDKPIPDFLVHFQIRQGLGDMPAFKEEELSKEEVEKIVLFVRSMRKNYKEANN